MTNTSDFTAFYHGPSKRFRTGVLVEVFNPRRGIVSQYVNGMSLGNGHIWFEVERDAGVKAYTVAAHVGRRLTPVAA